MKKSAHRRKRPLPTVDLSQPLPILAATIGKILKRKRAPIYRIENMIVSIEKGNRTHDGGEIYHMG